MTHPNIHIEHFSSTTVGREDGVPVHIALLRCRIYEREFNLDFEEAHNPAETLLWWDDDIAADRTIRYVAVPTPPAPSSGVTVIEIGPDKDAPPGWSLSEPSTGRFGHEVTWYTGHRADKLVVADGYAVDLSVLAVVTTTAVLQQANVAAGLTPAFEPDLPRPRIGELKLRGVGCRSWRARRFYKSLPSA